MKYLTLKSEVFVSLAQQAPRFSLLSAAQVSLTQHEPETHLMAALEAKAEPSKTPDDEYSREWFLEDEVHR